MSEDNNENVSRPPMEEHLIVVFPKVAPSVGEHLRGPSGEGIAETDTEGRVISGEAPPGGPAEIVIQIRPPQGEEDTLRACRTLVECLNGDGGKWHNPVLLEPSPEKVDCEALQNDGPPLRMQVVRATVDTRFYADAAAGRYAQGATRAFVPLADEIRGAIQYKSDDIGEEKRPGLTLVLNARVTPAHALEEVVKAFTNSHGAWARALGFNAIWIVCLTPDQVYRLDT